METLAIKTLQENACVVEKHVTFTLETEEINELEDALAVVARYVNAARVKSRMDRCFGSFSEEKLELDHQTNEVVVILKVGSIG